MEMRHGRLSACLHLLLHFCCLACYASNNGNGKMVVVVSNGWDSTCLPSPFSLLFPPTFCPNASLSSLLSLWVFAHTPGWWWETTCRDLEDLFTLPPTTTPPPCLSHFGCVLLTMPALMVWRQRQRQKEKGWEGSQHGKRKKKWEDRRRAAHMHYM